MSTKHSYYCEACCKTFDQDDCHCPICGSGMVTPEELINEYFNTRNIFGVTAVKLKVIYEELVDYELPKEAPKQNPSYRDEPETEKMWYIHQMLLNTIDTAKGEAEELESRLDERNR